MSLWYIPYQLIWVFICLFNNSNKSYTLNFQHSQITKSNLLDKRFKFLQPFDQNRWLTCIWTWISRLDNLVYVCARLHLWYIITFVQVLERSYQKRKCLGEKKKPMELQNWFVRIEYNIYRITSCGVFTIQINSSSNETSCIFSILELLTNLDFKNFGSLPGIKKMASNSSPKMDISASPP